MIRAINISGINRLLAAMQLVIPFFIEICVIFNGRNNKNPLN